MISNLTFAPIFVGVDQGIYLKHGIDLKIKMLTAANDLVKALEVGQADFSASSWVVVASAVSQGASLKVFSPVFGDPNVANYDKQLAIIARPGFDAKGVADLKGHSIATLVGNATELWLRTQLTEVGLGINDVKIVNAPMPSMLSIIQRGAADAAITAEPYGVLVLDTVSGSHVVARGGGFAETRVLLTTTGPWLQQHPDLAARIVESNAEAAQFVRQHPDQAAAITSHYLTGLDLGVLTDALKVLDWDPRWSATLQKGMDDATQGLLANGSIKTAPKTTDILALNMLNGMNEKYAQYFSDLK
ncbi:MAG: ABC transporter substrate-binding protein [Chloroflexota bacterium]|nr:ABC transporter substrate-binding protein [Chloroflexota bacterium]